MRLDGILANYAFKRKSVLGNGDCCFLAVAHGIENFLLDGSQLTICAHFASLGFFIGQNIMDRVLLLRSLVVQEFLGSHSADYAMFLVQSERASYEEMATNFLQLGFFDCELGNGVLLALANILQCTILAFTSIESYPIIPLLCRNQPLSQVPLYVAFNNSGKGHYDAVSYSASDEGVSVIEDPCIKTSETTTQAHVKCKCGRGAASSKSKGFCNSYSSRCKCFQSFGGCHDDCSCLNCANPYGKKTPEASMDCKPKRKRTKHHNTPTSSHDFLQAKKESLGFVKWTDYENFVLQQIIDIVVDDDTNPD